VEIASQQSVSLENEEIVDFILGGSDNASFDYMKVNLKRSLGKLGVLIEVKNLF